MLAHGRALRRQNTASSCGSSSHRRTPSPDAELVATIPVRGKDWRRSKEGERRYDVADIVQLALVKERALLRERLEEEYYASIPPLQRLRSPIPTDPVVEKVRGRGRAGRIYSHLACCLLKPGHEPRRSAILLVESRWFDPFILLTILGNCFTMAWESPLDPSGTWKARLIDDLEWSFLLIFTVELLVKMLAYGLYQSKGSYLRDPWCQLDLLVVMSAWLPIIFSSMSSYSGLRAFRALRPLRALKRLPGMPLLVQWILDVMPKMANVLTLFTFCFLVFGIIGTELFKGVLHYRCALPGWELQLAALQRDAAEAAEAMGAVTGLGGGGVVGGGRVGGFGGAGAVGGGAAFAAPMSAPPPHLLGQPRAVLGPEMSAFDSGHSCNQWLTSDSPADAIGQCHDGSTCAYFVTNPNKGLQSYDSVPYAFVSLVQATTFDDWAEAMYALMTGFSPLVWVFFVLVVLVGGFFVVNLFLAVIFLEFASSQDRILEANQKGEEMWSPLNSERSERSEADGTTFRKQISREENGLQGEDAGRHHGMSLTSAQLIRAPSSPPPPEAPSVPPSPPSPPGTPPPPGLVPVPVPGPGPGPPGPAPAPGPLGPAPLPIQVVAVPPASPRAKILLPLAAEGAPSAPAADVVQRLDSEAPEAPLLGKTTAAAPPPRPASSPLPLFSYSSSHPCNCTPGEDDYCRQAVASVAQSHMLSHISTVFVLINMVVMCMPYEGMPHEHAEVLEQIARGITWVFIVEMAIKLLGLGCYGYWQDGWNMLDGTIVSLSIFEMIFTAISSSSGGVKLSFLRILRILRVLRVLRLMRSWRGLYRIVTTFLRVMPQMSNLMILIVLSMFMFALLGMQLFGGLFTEENGYSSTPCPAEICEDGLLEKPHFHFDYCSPAMITIFIILTGEWYDAMEPVTTIYGGGAAIFFIAVVLIGKFFLLNLLVAVILHEFADEANGGTPGSSSSGAGGSAEGVELGDGRSSPASPPESPSNGLLLRSPSPLSGRREGDKETEMSAPRRRWTSLKGVMAFTGSNKAVWPRDYSLLLFSNTHPLRQACLRAIKLPWWDRVVIAAIIASSLCLVLDSPRLDQSSPLVFALRRLDIFFTCLFIVEMCTKVIALGFACGQGSYLSSPWNQVDFAIVLVSILVLLAEALPQLQSLRVLRVARVLRPLRLVSRNAGMKLIITSLFKAMPAVGNVFAVVLCLQVVFAIIGMQLFSGTMASCNNPAYRTRAECEAAATGIAGGGGGGGGGLADVVVGSEAERRGLKGQIGGAAWDPNSMKVVWANPTVGSFDDFGSAMRLLYVMSSADEWEDPMYLMMGATEPGVAPARNDFSPYALFPMVWMFFSFIFAINLFVGVVVDNFSRMEKAENGSATMTTQQQQWAATMKASVTIKPNKAPRPPNPDECCGRVRGLAYSLITSTFFDGVITTVICSNIALMACDYYLIEDDAFYATFTVGMRTFTYVYYIECALKLYALGAVSYFGDGWSRFDFALVCMALADQFAEDLLSKYMPLPPMLPRVMRIFRILRILRLLRHAKGLRDLIVTMILSFPSLLNVASLLALIIFIYAVLGRQMFTFLAHGGVDGTIHGGINGMRNFVSFSSSYLLLFQCLTGDGWSSLMADAMIDDRSAICSSEVGDCGTVAAVPYFISFQVLGCFVFVNLIVAVILENFATLHHMDPNLVSTADLELFSDAWAEFDPDATNFVKIADLPYLLLKVPSPLGLKGKSEVRARQLCMRLRLRADDGMIAFRDLLLELVDNNYFRSGTDLNEDEFKGLVPQLRIDQIADREAKTHHALTPYGASALVGSKDAITDLEEVESFVALKSMARHERRLALFFASETLKAAMMRSFLVEMLRRARQRIAYRSQGGKEEDGKAEGYEVMRALGTMRSKEVAAAAIAQASMRKRRGTPSAERSTKAASLDGGGGAASSAPGCGQAPDSLIWGEESHPGFSPEARRTKPSSPDAHGLSSPDSRASPVPLCADRPPSCSGIVEVPATIARSSGGPVEGEGENKEDGPGPGQSKPSSAQRPLTVLGAVEAADKQLSTKSSGSAAKAAGLVAPGGNGAKQHMLPPRPLRQSEHDEPSAEQVPTQRSNRNRGKGSTSHRSHRGANPRSTQPKVGATGTGLSRPGGVPAVTDARGSLHAERPIASHTSSPGHEQKGAGGAGGTVSGGGGEGGVLAVRNSRGASSHGTSSRRSKPPTATWDWHPSSGPRPARSVPRSSYPKPSNDANNGAHACSATSWFAKSSRMDSLVGGSQLTVSGTDQGALELPSYDGHYGGYYTSSHADPRVLGSPVRERRCSPIRTLLLPPPAPLPQSPPTQALTTHYGDDQRLEA